jgi:hypothetical protein
MHNPHDPKVPVIAYDLYNACVRALKCTSKQESARQMCFSKTHPEVPWCRTHAQVSHPRYILAPYYSLSILCLTCNERILRRWQERTQSHTYILSVIFTRLTLIKRVSTLCGH